MVRRRTENEYSLSSHPSTTRTNHFQTTVVLVSSPSHKTGAAGTTLDLVSVLPHCTRVKEQTHEVQSSLLNNDLFIRRDAPSFKTTRPRSHSHTRGRGSGGGGNGGSGGGSSGVVVSCATRRRWRCGVKRRQLAPCSI